MIMQRIRALERKLAKELAAITADEAVTAYIDEWEEARQKDLPAPNPFEFCWKLVKTVGCYFYETERAQHYLEDCLDDGIVPDSRVLFYKLLPDYMYA